MVCFCGGGVGYCTSVSETYEVLDCIIVDVGTTGTPDSRWMHNSSSIQCASDETGTTVTNVTTDVGRTYWINAPNTTSSDPNDWNKPLCVEFDIVEFTGGNIAFQMVKSNIGASKTFSNLAITPNCHIKVEYIGSTVKFYRDGTELTNAQVNNVDISDFEVRFYLPASTSFKYKNFMLYPI